MGRASASGAVDSGLIPSPVKPMTLELAFPASLLDTQHERDCVKNKQASAFAAQLKKTLHRIPPFRSGRQMAGNSCKAQ